MYVCEATLILPSELEDLQSNWYIRAEHPRNRKSYANSNTRPFHWVILQPNLRSYDLDFIVTGSITRFSANIINDGDAKAENFLVHLDLTITAANTAPVKESSQKLVNRLLHTGPVGPGLTTFTYDININGLPRPIKMVGILTVDPNNRIAEINVSDNRSEDRDTIF
jgi:hypothetical protein